MNSLEDYFQKFRQHIIGIDFEHPFEAGKKPIVYADWAASGRLYRPIENYIINELGPYVANTHTETTLTGKVMTNAYLQAHEIIKKHVNASAADQLLFAGFGMTAVVNKFQRILGLRVPTKYKQMIAPARNDRPLVIITHMEHHSNQITWLECLCDVLIIRRDENGLPDLNHLQDMLKSNRQRKLIIGAFTACSNVTGLLTPFYEMAELVHAFGGYCFIDFSASAPYVEINMHPPNPQQQLDAIFFSPHKFLGGPGASGVIVFNKALYNNPVPDQPGGGTVTWTNPWGGHRFFENIEVREDGGTPGFLQGIKAALAILLKEEMGTEKLLEREHHLTTWFMDELSKLDLISILEGESKNRVGYISFHSPKLHHNLMVRLLNDQFGIQTRGGCSCAGTYGHILFHINYDESKRITNLIELGDLSQKPGWVRVSLHPIMTSKEIEYILEAIRVVLKNYERWQTAYKFNIHSGDFELVNKTEFKIDLNRTFRPFL